MVEVTANGLPGYWKVTAAKTVDFSLGMFSGVRILYSGEKQDRDVCVIRQTGPRIAATCSSGISPSADGALDGDRVTLRWWNGPANLIFDGMWDDDATISGGFSGGLAGVSVTGEIPATLTKVSRTADRPASATVLLGVFDDLRWGNLTEDRYEAAAIKRMKPAVAWSGAAAAEHEASFLGQIHVRWRSGQPDLIEDVYEVRTADRLSLSRIALV